jgi:hypothetical protein
VPDALDVVNTVADPDYVTASASRERLELAKEAGGERRRGMVRK